MGFHGRVATHGVMAWHDSAQIAKISHCEHRKLKGPCFAGTSLGVSLETIPCESFRKKTRCFAGSLLSSGVQCIRPQDLQREGHSLVSASRTRCCNFQAIVVIVSVLWSPFRLQPTSQNKSFLLLLLEGHTEGDEHPAAFWHFQLFPAICAILQRFSEFCFV